MSSPSPKLPIAVIFVKNTETVCSAGSMKFFTYLLTYSWTARDTGERANHVTTD